MKDTTKKKIDSAISLLVIIFLILLIIGLIQPRWFHLSSRWVVLGVFGGPLLVFLYIGGILGSSIASKTVKKAEHLWTAGKHKEAAELYKEILDKWMNYTNKESKITILRRLIDYSAGEGKFKAALEFASKGKSLNIGLGYDYKSQFDKRFFKEVVNLWDQGEHLQAAEIFSMVLAVGGETLDADRVKDVVENSFREFMNKEKKELANTLIKNAIEKGFTVSEKILKKIEFEEIDITFWPYFGDLADGEKISSWDDRSIARLQIKEGNIVLKGVWKRGKIAETVSGGILGEMAIGPLVKQNRHVKLSTDNIAKVLTKANSNTITILQVMEKGGTEIHNFNVDKNDNLFLVKKFLKQTFSEKFTMLEEDTDLG